MWSSSSLTDIKLGQLLNDLEAGGALTACQAEMLRQSWPNLDEDLATNPYLGTVREHTRAYLGIPSRDRT